MGADISRQRFDHRNNYNTVLMQQGRVQLDAEWNEWAEILDRRWRAETTDLLWTAASGRAVVPRQTPQGFEIGRADSTLTIGPGRAYVDGLLAENHGKAPLTFDPVLGERRGVAITYDEQPYLGHYDHSEKLMPLPTTAGSYLVYLDVWQREVTFVEEPDLIESAVGVDTTTRIQTAWQVRVLPSSVGNLTCATPDIAIPRWSDLTRASAGRLSVEGVPDSTTDNPCQVPPGGGYQGLENRLYRVEIHTVDDTGAAMFKWSRDNASIVAVVTGIKAAELKVNRIGRDDELRFQIGDWVEVRDNRLEFAGKPGHMSKVADVREADRVIVLENPPPASYFPTDPKGQVYAERRTCLRRWDQKGKVLTASGDKYHDLDAPSSPTPGAIRVPTDGRTLQLEHGIQVTFSLDPTITNGRFRVGDYWVFAARTADASVEELTDAPPRGPHHHYARLAVVTFPLTLTEKPADCRIQWPPEATAGAGCDCTVFVTPESHRNGTPTIQGAIKLVKAAGGGKVCLEVGEYQLGSHPLQLDSVRSVRLTGRGPETVLKYGGKGPAVVVDRARDVTLEEFRLDFGVEEEGTAIGILLKNCLNTTVQRCHLAQIRGRQAGGRRMVGLAIGLNATQYRTTIRDNHLVTDLGIASLRADESAQPPDSAEFDRRADTPLRVYTHLRAVRIEDNVLSCGRAGVRLDGYTLHAGPVRLAGNQVEGSTQACIAVGGVTEATGIVDVIGNKLRVSGEGIVAGADKMRIVGNDLMALGKQEGAGIVLAPGVGKSGISRAMVLGNRVSGMKGPGIAVRASVGSALIKNNIIEDVGGGGVVMDREDSTADAISITNNQIRRVARADVPAGALMSGIQVFRVRRAQIEGNVVQEVGPATGFPGSPRTGILVVASSSVRIAGNEVMDIGMANVERGDQFGILVHASFERLEVTENVLSRTEAPAEGQRLDCPALLVIPFEPEEWKRDSPFGFVRDGTRGFFRHRLVRLGPAGGEVAVRGNLLASYGGLIGVELNVRGSCLFTDNHCQGHTRDVKPDLLVLIQAGAIIASNNFLKYVPKKQDQVVMKLGGRSVAVLGNIAAGAIELLGKPKIQPHWADLNVMNADLP